MPTGSKRTSKQALSREVPIDAAQAALLFVDVQNYSARADGGEYSQAGLTPARAREKHGYYFDRLATLAIPNMQKLQKACRDAGVEVMYTVIESLTQDGRDRSLDYKITGFHVPRGSWDAQVLAEVAPAQDEIVVPKTSSNVFISTNIHYILGNLGVKQLIVAGLVTDQCVNSAVRDGCDLGYLITLVPDACATYTEERHEKSIEHIKGYCRRRNTDELIAELGGAATAS
ncbi:MAG: isochorismatase family cysteine hydrolase [Gammaproteobacteria bacterium]